MDADVQQRSAAGDVLLGEPAARIAHPSDQAGLRVVHLPELTGVDEGLQHLAVGRVATHETDLDHPVAGRSGLLDRQGRSESTRLNSSHVAISYAVFCLKKQSR